MWVENFPALQAWLAPVLRPLCDADPNALAKYVIALLKKEVPESELCKTMVEQLEIFLQEHTTPFVAKLIDQIHTKEYVHEYETLRNTDGELPNGSLKWNQNNEKEQECKGETDFAASNSNNSESLQISNGRICVEDYPSSLETSRNCEDDSTILAELTIGGTDSARSSVCSSDKGADVETKIYNKNRDQFDHDMKDRSKLREKRSRSRSSGCSPTTKLRKGCQYYGSASTVRPASSRIRPPLQRSPVRRRIRRDLRTSYNHTRAVHRSRSPFKSRPLHLQRNLSQGRYKRTARSKSTSPPPSQVKTRSTENSALDMPKGNLKSVVVKPGSESPQKDEAPTLRIRCRDFDEKGLCMRGELCPYDHGVDPVVLEDVIPNSANVPVNFTKPDVDKSDKNFMNCFLPLKHVPGEYYPENPSLVPPTFGWNPPVRHFRPRQINFDSLPIAFPGPDGMTRPHLMRPYGTHGRRQLVTCGTSPEGFIRNSYSGPRKMCKNLLGTKGRGRGSFDYSRLGARPVTSFGNCCLEVRKIPKDSNRIDILMNHFSRFGNVVGIQTSLNNDPTTAVVTFSSHEEALQTFRSTDAILNNRFIKVFWHTQDNKSENFNSDSVVDRPKLSSVFRRENSAHNVMDQEIRLDFNESENIEEIPDLFDQGKRQVTSTTSNPCPGTPNKIHSCEKMLKDTNVKDANQELHKPRQDMVELMSAQIQEQKNLIKTLETNGQRMTVKQKEEIFSMIRTLQKSCQDLRNNVEMGSVRTNTPSIQNNGYPKVCSQEEILRKILDAELELYARERKGQETLDLEKKILKLRAEDINII